MTRRQKTPSVVRSKKFAVTAAISAVAAGTALGIATGIIPAKSLTPSWSTHEEVPRPGSSLPAKPAIAGRRYEGTRETTRPRPDARTQNPNLFKRIFGRLAALFTRETGARTRLSRDERPHLYRTDGDARSAAEPSGRNVRRYDSAASLTEAAQPAELDSREFGVGSIGLGLGGNGGPIAAAGPGGAGGAQPQGLAYDPYFDPNESIPEVDPGRSRMRGGSVVPGTPAADGPAFDEGANGALNAQAAGAAGARTPSGGARETAGTFEDTAADYSRQKTADDAWADKKGGADLKKHKIRMPEVGGGKGIRNAPSRTR